MKKKTKKKSAKSSAKKAVEQMKKLRNKPKVMSY